MTESTRGNSPDNHDAATESRERHTLRFEDFDLRVSVEDDGTVWVSFHGFGKCLLTMAWDDLREVVDFAAVHGLKMSEPYIVEMGAAEKAGLT